MKKIINSVLAGIIIVALCFIGFIAIESIILQNNVKEIAGALLAILLSSILIYNIGTKK